MHPPTKDQSDIGVENPTVDASDRPDNRDLTRQEYKDEADINYMLAKFNVTPPRGAPTYGEWDDTLDLQMAITSVKEAQAGYATLPKELREKFPSMEDFITAVDNGSLIITHNEPKDAARTAPPISDPAPPVA